MIFSVNCPIIIYVLLGVAFVLTVIIALCKWCKAKRLARFVDDEQEREYLADDQLPKASVVVYAHNDAEWLENFLPTLLHQDYPDYEVIVVDDASTDASRNLISDMLIHYPQLHLTLTPDRTRGLSRKKLSLMLGIKAAQGEVVVTTNANCCVTSDQWLRLMLRNFVPGTDVVIGYSHYRYKSDRSAGHCYRAFDTVTVGEQYLTSAIAGKPYRGVSDNLAYRRDIFFQNNGFSKNLDLRWGDDDVFLCEIANGDNTRVELLPEAQVVACYENVSHAHTALKMRRDFTSRKLPHRWPFIAQGLLSTLNYARLGCLAAAVALDWNNVFTLSVVAVLLIVSWVLAILPVRKSCRVLHAPLLSAGIPLYNMCRPLVNLCYRLRGHKLSQSNLTSIFD